MRRRGTVLMCEACNREMFVKNLKGYSRWGWKYVRKYKADICPVCVDRKVRTESEQGVIIPWEDLILSNRVKGLEEKVKVVS